MHPLTVSATRLHELTSHLLLLYTGITRTVSDAAPSRLAQLDQKKRSLRILNELVDEAVTILERGQDLRRFGALFHEAWLVKRGLGAAVSNPRVDDIYREARRGGALGGKLTGAGEGGFMLLFAPPECHGAIRERLKHLLAVPFQFDFGGSRIIFDDRERHYEREEAEREHQRLDAFTKLQPPQERQAA